MCSFGTSLFADFVLSGAGSFECHINQISPKDENKLRPAVLQKDTCLLVWGGSAKRRRFFFMQGPLFTGVGFYLSTASCGCQANMLGKELEAQQKRTLVLSEKKARKK